MSRRQNITVVSAAVTSVLAERGIRLAEPKQVSRPAIVYLAGDVDAEARARELWRASGGALVPVRTAGANPADARARAARMRWEAAYGMSAPLVEKRAEAQAIEAAHAVTVVATLVDGRLAAPLAAFLSAHDLAGKHLAFEVGVPADRIRPAFFRAVAERLPRGAEISVTARAESAPKACVDGGLADGFAQAAAQARALMAARRGVRRAA